MVVYEDKEGYIHIDEPFPKLFNQGMLHKDGFVMSKSRGNVILPEAVSKQYGIDTARLFLVSIASPDKDTEWSDKGVEGSLRFINKIFDYFDNVKFGKTSKIFESKLHKTIKEVADSIEAFKYNIAIIKIRELFESREEEINKKDLEIFVKLLAPFCPHITEELWQLLKSLAVSRQPSDKDKKSLTADSWSIHQQSWPKFDNKYLEDEEVIIVVQVNGKMRDQLVMQKDIVNNKEVVEKLALESPKVKKFLSGKQIKQAVYVPVKIINFVVD